MISSSSLSQRTTSSSSDIESNQQTFSVQKEKIHIKKSYEEVVQFRNSAYWFFLSIQIVTGGLICYFILFADYIRAGWPNQQDYETFVAFVAFVWFVMLFITIQFRNNWQIMQVAQFVGAGMVGMGFSIVHLKLFVCPSLRN